MNRDWMRLSRRISGGIGYDSQYYITEILDPIENYFTVSLTHFKYFRLNHL